MSDNPLLLAIDAGNTNTVFAVYDGDEVVAQWRLATDPRRTADEYAVWLQSLMQLKALDPSRIRAGIIATVVPQTLFALRMLMRHYFGAEALVVGEEGVDIGIRVVLDRPREVGADRLVNAVAAWTQYKQALVILDFGTATTFDVVDGDGAYIGGVIAPGIQLSMEALHRAAAKLPNVAVARPEKVIGGCTESAMQSGIYFGYLSLIEGIVSRIRAEYAEKRPDLMKIIATGGLAPLFAAGTEVIEALDTDLTIAGLKFIYERNQHS
jgi:type III pantothenate kinase